MLPTELMQEIVVACCGRFGVVSQYLLGPTTMVFLQPFADDLPLQNGGFFKQLSKCGIQMVFEQNHCPGAWGNLYRDHCQLQHEVWFGLPGKWCRKTHPEEGSQI